MVEVGRLEVEEQGAQPLGGGHDGLLHRPDRVEQLRRLLRDPAPQQPQSQVDDGQGLHRVVVDVTGDLGALGLLRLDEPLEQRLPVLREAPHGALGGHPLGHVALHGGQAERRAGVGVVHEEARDGHRHRRPAPEVAQGRLALPRPVLAHRRLLDGQGLLEALGGEVVRDGGGGQVVVGTQPDAGRDRRDSGS